MFMNMVPDASVFIQIDGNDKILANGHPASQWRTELRHIPNFRNALSIASLFFNNLLKYNLFFSLLEVEIVSSILT